MTGQISALVREIIDRMYPVSIILDFAAETDPNVSIGCGTQWERMTDGRTLIASDAEHVVGWTGGTTEETLNVDQIPPHNHIYRLENGDYTDNQTAILPWRQNISYQKWWTETAGGGQPHNNMQPSLAVCRWQRVA